MSAPVINSPIEGGDGIIEGNFSTAEVDNFVAILNAGKLPVSLVGDPLVEEYVPARM